MRRVFGADTQPSQQELDAFWELVTHNQGRMVLYRLIHYMTDRKQHRERWLTALREACVPIQLINGASDPVSGEHMVARYRELVSEPLERDDMIVSLPEVGHYPHTEAPEQVLDAYLNFLNSLPLAPKNNV